MSIVYDLGLGKFFYNNFMGGFIFNNRARAVRATAGNCFPIVIEISKLKEGGLLDRKDDSLMPEKVTV